MNILACRWSDLSGDEQREAALVAKWLGHEYAKTCSAHARCWCHDYFSLVADDGVFAAELDHPLHAADPRVAAFCVAASAVYADRTKTD